MSWYDYARYRLSVFTREEASAIVAYLTYKRDAASTRFEEEGIEAAPTSFWLDRAQTAPSAESLQRHLREEDAYLAAIRSGKEKP